MGWSDCTCSDLLLLWLLWLLLLLLIVLRPMYVYLRLSVLTWRYWDDLDVRTLYKV